MATLFDLNPPSIPGEAERGAAARDHAGEGHCW